ncbi:MAG: hypothetical protein ACLFUN_06865, partial [Desulfobacterales bacterium]
MKSDTETEPLHFAQRFLQLHGAAVETSGSAIEALIPEELRALLDVPEHIRISGDNEYAADNNEHYVVTYGAPLLERMIGGTLEKIPMTACRLEFDYIKSGGFERLIEDQLTFYGARASIETTAEVSASYMLVACRYTAQSDEHKEGLLTMVFNSDTGGFVPDMAEALDSAGCRTSFTLPGPDAHKSVVSLSNHIEKTAHRFLEDRLEPFRASMNRRFQRDVANLNEYY